MVEISKANPRYKNGSARRKARAWVLATYTHCAICGQYVDQSLATPHPMSAEVDEIIPISKGGSAIARDNLQLTHRCCNNRKGNKLLIPQEKINRPLKSSGKW